MNLKYIHDELAEHLALLGHVEARLHEMEQHVLPLGHIGRRSDPARLTQELAVDLLDQGEDMIEPVADRPGHDRRYAIDAAKIGTELGWAPTRSAWPGALAETIEWYRAHEPWWRPLKAFAFNATMLPQRP